VLAEEATDKTLSTDEANAQEVQNFKIKYNNFTILTFVLIALSLIAASASGIGGGGILVGSDTHNVVLSSTLENFSSFIVVCSVV
jgi:uncharacterized Tic20 family protein